MITDAQLKAARKAQYDAMRQAERDKLPVQDHGDIGLRAALLTVDDGHAAASVYDEIPANSKH